MRCGSWLAAVSAEASPGVPDDEQKDAQGSAGYDPEGIVPRAIRAIKEAVPDLLVWADVCLCGSSYCDSSYREPSTTVISAGRSAS